MHFHHPSYEVHETSEEESLKHQELLLFWYRQQQDHKYAMLVNAYSQKYMQPAGSTLMLKLSNYTNTGQDSLGDWGSATSSIDFPLL